MVHIPTFALQLLNDKRENLGDSENEGGKTEILPLQLAPYKKQLLLLPGGKIPSCSSSANCYGKRTKIGKIGAELMGAASFRWILQLHKDVPRAARFYSDGLDFSINVCTYRWAELQSGPLKLALMHSNSEQDIQKGYSSLLSFTVTDINSTVSKLMALGAELDGPIKYEINGKVAAMRCIDGHLLGLYEPT